MAQQMRELNVVQAVREALLEEMRADERVMVLGEDVGVRGGVFRATEGLLEEFGDLRVLDTPISESAIVGVAIGAAMNGMRPVAEIQFADFIHSAVDQIVSEAAKIRYRSRGQFSCPIVVRAPYGGGVQGALYHSQSVEGLFYNVPGLKIVAPSTPYDTKGLLKAAIRDPDPVLFFEHKRTYRLIREQVPEGDYIVPLGQAAVRREGDDITVISYGLMMHLCLQAADELARETGIQVEVIDLRTLRPLDTATILASVRKTGKVLIVHEANKMGGVGAEIAAIISEEALYDLDAPIRRLTPPESPAAPFNRKLEQAYFPDAERIRSEMESLARY